MRREQWKFIHDIIALKLRATQMEFISQKWAHLLLFLDCLIMREKWSLILAFTNWNRNSISWLDCRTCFNGCCNCWAFFSFHLNCLCFPLWKKCFSQKHAKIFCFLTFYNIFNFAPVLLQAPTDALCFHHSATQMHFAFLY